jgi:hypothetical protein
MFCRHVHVHAHVLVQKYNRMYKMCVRLCMSCARVGIQQSIAEARTILAEIAGIRKFFEIYMYEENEKCITVCTKRNTPINTPSHALIPVVNYTAV